MKLALAAVLSILAVAACGSGDTGTGPNPAPVPASQGSPAPGPTTQPGPQPTTTTAACAGKAKPAKLDDTWQIPFGGDTREVIVHLPPSYDPSHPYPVVLNFHGYTSDAPQEEVFTGMNDKADTAGFLAIYPQGTGSPQSWNAGSCCGDALKNLKDDVGFTSLVIDTLEDRLCVDAKRVYATGMSNGGFMSHRLACELSTRIAAVAPVAGVLGIQQCNPARPVPIMHFHGTLDPLVPYDGSSALGFVSVPTTFEGWAKREGCTGDPVETYRKADSHCSTYQACNGGSQVTLCTVDGGGHTWPGGVPVPTLGYTTTNLNATDAMWDFFSRYSLP